ncbi:MAG: NAD(P)-dependent oxidoreductase [Planctomycetota bacterium]|jgi:3-hydroxyisobutyrate dehydrogenase
MGSEIRRVAWIGTGVMGAAMANRLLEAGYELVVHNRTRAKAQPLLDSGAGWAGSPAEAAGGADVAVSMVGFPEDVEATHLGPSGTLAASAVPPLIVDMTTSRPSLAVRIHEEAAAKGAGSVDAPVSGGDVGAREGTLSIMVGAERSHFESVRPLFEVLGRQIVHQGGAGSGQQTKMVNQILIATNMIGLCEGLLYAAKAGLDPKRVLESVGSGAAGSWSLANLGPRMMRRDFAPGFFVDHFIKDLGIALDEAARLGLALPGLALVRQLYLSVRALGHGRCGTQALLLALERLNGLEQEIETPACPEPVP